MVETCDELQALFISIVLHSFQVINMRGCVCYANQSGYIHRSVKKKNYMATKPWKLICDSLLIIFQFKSNLKLTDATLIVLTLFSIICMRHLNAINKTMSVDE